MAVRKKAARKKVSRKRSTQEGRKKGAAQPKPLNEASNKEGAKEDSEESDGQKLSRREIVDRALDKMGKIFEGEDTPTKETVANLVQILKLHKDLVEEEDVPKEIRVLWPGWNEEATD